MIIKTAPPPGAFSPKSLNVLLKDSKAELITLLKIKFVFLSVASVGLDLESGAFLVDVDEAALCIVLKQFNKARSSIFLPFI